MLVRSRNGEPPPQPHPTHNIYTHWAHLVISTLLPLLAEVPEGMFGHDLIHAQDLRCALDRKALWEDG